MDVVSQDFNFGDGDFTIDFVWKMDMRPLALCRAQIYFRVNRWKNFMGVYNCL